MIVRIVELQIQPEKMPEAQVLLEEVAPKVRAMPGCNYLEILADVHKHGHVTTYSYWDSEADLNTYRDSEVFISFWKSVKTMFAEKARAWSSERLIHKP